VPPVIKVVIADDHTIVRQGIRALLTGVPDIRVVGEAKDGVEALKLVEDVDPDVLVVDLMMPGLGGLEVTRRVTQRKFKTRVVILSMHEDEAYVVESLTYGALGYVLKDSTSEELVTAVREAAQGNRYLSSKLSERSLSAFLESRRRAPTEPLDLLTSREREVILLASEGRTNADIADRLVISPRTVEIHRANAMKKLGLHSQTDLIRFAIRRGILPDGN
jgi:two-component system response regulator NreC